MRVKPSPRLAVAIVAGYAVYLVIAVLISGVDYDEIADSTGNVVAAVLVPVGIGSVGLAALTRWLGWWPEVIGEVPSGPRWLLVVPILFLLSALVTTVSEGFGSLSATLVIVLAVSVLFVGFSEELLTRGLALFSLRGGGLPEVWVWLLTSLLFGLLHGINLLFGQGAGETIAQVAFAFVFGSVLYLVRRVTGTLVICMLLHAFWDFSVFLGEAEGGGATTDAARGLAGVISYAAAILAAYGLFRLLRRGGSTGATPEPAPGAAGG